MNKQVKYCYYGIYSGLIDQYLEYKHALGFYSEDIGRRLRCFDRLTIERRENVIGITKELFDEWGALYPFEAPSNQYIRISILRGFSAYLQLIGYESHVPKLPKYRSNFTPHIYTKSEMAAIFRECDKLHVYRHYMNSMKCVMPSLIRVLYGTGIRISEAMRLTHGDVNLSDGILTLRECKNGQDRIAPMSLSLTEVCKDFVAYKQSLGLNTEPNASFFTAANGSTCCTSTISVLFRTILYRAGLPCAGRGNNPRLHDLRHTFCVNALVKMSESGMDLYYSMPVLMTYMGHKSLSATNRYVRITEEMYPDLIQKVNEVYKYVFPEIGIEPSKIQDDETN